MANHEKEIKKLTSLDNKLAGGFNRSEMWCVVVDAKPKPVKDDMVFSNAYKLVGRSYK